MPFLRTDPDILRLLDANLNRAREGLRVIEDYTRFIRNDFTLGERLKTLRQQLASATRSLATQAIAHRDVTGDVGTAFSSANAPQRESMQDVVTAAGKRVGEALRAIEEYLKTIDASAAKAVEATRYAFYDVEQAVAVTFSQWHRRLTEMRLYVIITESQCAGRSWEACALAAIAGGAGVLQLREKSLESGELLSRAKTLVTMCRDAGVVSIINDRPDIALLADADGVHVGQNDLACRDVRKLIGSNRIVGVSTHDIEHARQAVGDGADYIGVGPIFKSTTKPRDFVSGLDYARQVSTEIRLPAVGIAGITPQNVREVMDAGLNAIAITSAVVGAPDVEAAARAFATVLSDAPRD